MRCRKICEFLDNHAPALQAEAWDNVGLLLGSSKQQINKVLVCLDVTNKVISEAKQQGAELIVSHHPFIFSSLKSISYDNPKGAAIYELIKNNIAVYSMHTNYDVAEYGLNAALASKLDLNEITDLNQSGLGKVGRLGKPMSIDDFMKYVKDKLSIDIIRFIGENDCLVERVAVFCGSFDGDYSGMDKLKPDILVTGDIKHNIAVDILNAGYSVIDAGHYDTEKIMVSEVTKLIADNFRDIEVFSSECESRPFIYR